MKKLSREFRLMVKNFLQRKLPLNFLCCLFPWVVWPIKKKYMMAEKSFFANKKPWGETPSICQVHAVKGRYYVGHYVYGVLIIGVLFPKNLTRDLNEEEKAKYEGAGVSINGNPINPISLKA